MKYQAENIDDLIRSQQLVSELFTYIGNNHPQAYLAETPHNFFRLLVGQDPTARIKVFTARDNNEIKGCVIALIIANPLFVAKPFIHRFVNLTNNDSDFDDYVELILNSL